MTILYMVITAILGVLSTLFAYERGKRQLAEKNASVALRKAGEAEQKVKTLTEVTNIKEEGFKNDVEAIDRDNTGRTGIGGTIRMHDDADDNC